MRKPKKKKHAEETLGILAHLQKNVPQPAPEEAELEFPEDEEDEDEMPSLLAPKPPKKLFR